MSPYIKLPSIYALIIANTVPILGAVYWDWSIASILYLYFFESIVSGIYSLARILKVESVLPDRGVMETEEREDTIKRVMIVVVFCVVYGALLFFHFTILSVFFPLYLRDMGHLWIGVLSFVVSHGLSYYVNFLGEREYELLQLRDVIQMPFRRSMSMHLVVAFVGAAPVLLGVFGSTLAAVLFVVSKTVIDGRIHLWEHRLLWRRSGGVS